jgi:hypothetical protein
MAILTIITAIGLIGAILASNSFAPPFGSAIGILAGVSFSVYEHFKSGNKSAKTDVVYIRNGVLGGYTKQNSKVVIIVGFALMGAVSAFAWQALFLLLR